MTKFKDKLYRKGQIEIIGLAMLVILLVVILVIALKFSFNSNNDNFDIRNSLIANNLLNALLKQEGQINIKNLIYDCYFNSKKNLNKETTCKPLKEELDKILTLIINKDFEIKFSAESLEFYKQGNCGKGIESTQYRFKKNSITFIGSIKLC